MRLLPLPVLLLLALPSLATEPVNLTRGTCDTFDPVWSADSREIYYYSTCNPATSGGWQMQVMRADGSERRVISDRGDFRPKPSPDGKRVAFDSFRDGTDHEVYVSDPDGGNALRLTTHPGYDVGPSWSPDGQWLVFSSGQHPVDSARPHWYGESDLWLIRADGSERYRLTADPGDDIYPFWSADGKWISFTSWRDGNPEAYVISADGREQRRLTHSIARENNPRLSPDGRYVAFTSDRNGNHDVFVANADGSNATNVTAHPGHDADAAWSPDGKWFLFSSKRDGNWDIYRLPAAEAVPLPQPKPAPLRAARAAVNVTNHAGSDSFGALSPDGRTIVFQSDRNPASPYRDSALYALSLDTREVVALPHRFADARPSWSPDGREIVFESERDGDVDLYVLELHGMSVRKLFDETGAQTAARWSPDGTRVAYASGGDVWLAGADGTGKRNLTGHAAVDGAPAWSPDGKRLAFASNRDGNFELYTLDLESGAATRLTENEVADTAPAWSPDGRRIAYTTVIDGAAEVMLLDVRDGSTRNVSNHAAFDHQPAWLPDGCGLLFTSKRSGDLELWLTNVCG